MKCIFYGNYFYLTIIDGVPEGDGASYIKGGEKYNENIAVGDMKNCNGNVCFFECLEKRQSIGIEIRNFFFLSSRNLKF